MTEPSDPLVANLRRTWQSPRPGKLVGRGHPVGDFLEAHEWDLLEQGDGMLRVRAQLPAQVRNPRGQLFGGFTPTYADFIALHTYWAGREPNPGHPWLATVNMRVDYFAPIVRDAFVMDSRVLTRRGRICVIATRFLDDARDGPEGDLLSFAYTTLKET